MCKINFFCLLLLSIFLGNCSNDTIPTVGTVPDVDTNIADTIKPGIPDVDTGVVKDTTGKNDSVATVDTITQTKPDSTIDSLDVPYIPNDKIKIASTVEKMTVTLNGVIEIEEGITELDVEWGEKIDRLYSNFHTINLSCKYTDFGKKTIYITQWQKLKLVAYDSIFVHIEEPILNRVYADSVEKYNNFCYSVKGASFVVNDKFKDFIYSDVDLDLCIECGDDSGYFAVSSKAKFVAEPLLNSGGLQLGYTVDVIVDLENISGMDLSDVRANSLIIMGKNIPISTGYGNQFGLDHPVTGSLGYKDGEGSRSDMLFAGDRGRFYFSNIIVSGADALDSLDRIMISIKSLPASGYSKVDKAIEVVGYSFGEVADDYKKYLIVTLKNKGAVTLNVSDITYSFIKDNLMIDRGSMIILTGDKSTLAPGETTTARVSDWWMHGEADRVDFNYNLKLVQ